MRILIAGSRTYNDYNNFCDIMNFIIKEYTNGNIEIVSGGAKGADTLAEKYAKEKQIPITIFPQNGKNMVSLLALLEMLKCIIILMKYQIECVFVFGMGNLVEHNIILNYVKNLIRR